MTTGMLGSWSGTLGANTIAVSYALTSKGSALVETWGSGARQTVSVYHRADTGLAMTHYCGQGNQPYLEAVSADARRVVFRRRRVTSWGAEASVLETLELTWDGDILVRAETYVGHDGAAENTTIRFHRVLPGSPTNTGEPLG